MQYLRLWESYQSEAEIARICKQYGIKNWLINSEGLVDVDGDAYLYGSQELTRLPLKFGAVKGSFELYKCKKIESLEGSPQIVGGDFECTRNKLTTLEGGPQIVLGSYFCSENELTTLQGAPKRVRDYFICHANKLTSLKGAPEIIGRNLNCDFDNLTSLEGLPKSINGKPSSEWLLSKFEEGEFQRSLMSSIPNYALTPKLLDFVRNRYPDQYKLLKQRRGEDQEWKTDLTADMGNLGF